jgi:beta-glucanase (GH16 family)
MYKFLLSTLLFIISFSAFSQLLEDDFESNSTITWYADDVVMNTEADNPLKYSINPSSTSLKYEDIGGSYANVRFDSSESIIVEENTPFELMIYIPGSSLTGNQTNQISLKLQDKNLAKPWSNQTEIIKTVSLNQWVSLSFNFATDNYINLDQSSPDPSERTDFNRVLLQINGENNTDKVTAYIDNFYFKGGEAPNDPVNPNDPVYDELVWSDEFDTAGAINSNKWFHQTQLPNGNSWFNGEAQHYTDREDNTYVEDGIMNLVAKKETYTYQGVTKQYTSARLNSKFAFTYGRVEVRAKLPTGVGTWPAIWMLGKNINENGGYWDNEGYGNTPWPQCGEIDIMEHWGRNQNFVQSAMHTPSSYGGTINHGGQNISTASTEFHIYTLDWYEDRMVFSVDGVEHYTYNPTVYTDNTWPFYKDQYILLNTAIESNIDPNFNESTMQIDYVKVYQESNLGNEEVTPEQRLNISPNPTKNYVNVIKDNVNANQNLKIYTIQGLLVEEQELKDKSTQIDMSDWSSGIYLFKQISGKTNETYKIIKN